MSAEENKARIRYWVEEAWNTGHLAVAEEVYAPDYGIHELPPGFGNDREGLKRFVPTFRQAIPDMHVTIEDVIAEGDKVVWRVTVRGTHHGELLGIAPTGKAITVPAIIISRFAAGQVVEEWVAWDQLGMLQQLGAIPAPGHAGA